MKLISFRLPGSSVVRAGWLEGEWAISAGAAADWLRVASPASPSGRLSLIDLIIHPDVVPTLRGALGEERPAGVAYRLAAVELLAPLPEPRTLRDFYSFEAHVKTARANRGLEMIPEWYEAPVFYFSNPNAIFGPEATVPKPRATQKLDFELEVAVVIGKECRDLKPAEADSVIAGYLIMNDWSARDVQAKEMKVGLGPAKGKDFATSLGPWLVTPDELADTVRNGRPHLAMTARINGQEVARGNLGDLHFSFGEMLARASQDCTLYPGEVIGSGTVGTGCLLETGAHRWLEPGDVVELEVERLGVLRNEIG
ncbi:MAG TPA: fumarylacetoacetate hydrolase family protein [Symbiobacteriaceae bacterium]|nr:fumarylacetoacetate hydrolase family protein [Symbiobacteriaceae bacterium]